MTDIRKMPLEALIFDLDGTLVDTAPDLTRVTNLLLAEAGLPLLAPGQVRAMVGHGARQIGRAHV